MKAANIENGVVVALWEVPALDCYGDLYQLVEAPEWVRLGASWDGSKFTNPTNPNAKAEAWEAIKVKREKVKSGGVKVGDKWFHTDDASRIQHMALNMMGTSIPANLQWKTMDGSFVTMTQSLAGQVFQAVAALDMQAFAKAEQHRVAMESSNDPASYDFSAG